MDKIKILFKPKSVVIIFTVIFSTLFAVYLILSQTGTRIKAAAGVPTLFYTISPASVRPGQNFDLILMVNPNGASFNAFELYTNYDPAKVDFQNTANLSANIISTYVLINSTVDQGNNIITIIGTKTGLPISGSANREIARVKMKVNNSAEGDMFFNWSGGTKIGSNISIDPISGTFPIVFVPTLTPTLTKTPTPTPTDIPTPTPTPPSSGPSGLFFMLSLPDVLASNISLADVQIELRDGQNTIDTANVNLIQNSPYYQTGSTVWLNIPQIKPYTIFVKTSIGLGRTFTGVVLTPQQELDCIVGANASCGGLISQRDAKPLWSGDSDGFDTGSGSYNKVDSADLQILTQQFNRPASGFPSADFNLDGQIDINDLEIMGKNYGQIGD